jgi:hypothetical protein
MSVIQRQALGDALGLQGAQLAEFMKTEEERTNAQNSALFSQIAKFAGIGAVVLGIIGGIMGALTIVGVGFAGLGAMAMGALKGVAIGGLIGAAGGGIGAALGVGDVKSPAQGKTQVSTKEGGLYQLSDNDDFMAAPGLLQGFGQQSAYQNSFGTGGAAENGMEKLFKDLMAQNEKLHRDANRKRESAFANR